MPLLGAHLSIAGGYYKAAEAAGELGMETVQLFTKNNQQWQAKPISDAEADAFRTAVAAANLRLPCAHASYLINLASPKPELWEKSVAALSVEVQRAGQLGLAGLVLHPGTATDIDAQTGLDNIVRALQTVLERAGADAAPIWLETTAGQGASLGHRFEHLAELLDRVGADNRLGVCLDTCHVFAAGYPLDTPAEYATTINAFDATVGLQRLRALHLNDSKQPLGSRVDRHTHIGAGHLGLEPFRHLLNDVRLAHLPMYLETPKGTRDGRNLDAINLEQLRVLFAPL